MYLQPSKAVVTQGPYGPEITITHFKLCEDDGKYKKFIRMDKRVVELLQQIKIPIEDDFIDITLK